ncbi:MAG: 3-deoxy-manno-octulosonate cytidylyltransferase [Candidatus Goldiibacteriota bacterium]|jgi:3-deoxy-manno-octulosonate cytidylyltransferase (CMP-KDO synthetase)
MNIIGIIPARLKSTRLPEKMLAKVKGKTLIEHVYLNARKASCLKELYVATDNVRIKKVIEAAGWKAIMTPASCKSGTERIREALKTIRVNMNDIVVNIQGDEPLLEHTLIDKTVRALINDKSYDAATLATPIADKEEILDTSVVKVVVGRSGSAMYFSRAPIPFNRDGVKTGNGSYLKHVGLYAYRKSVLDRWLKLESSYEGIEKLEQLRMLENGCRIKVIIAKSKSIGIDTKADLNRLVKIIK